MPRGVPVATVAIGNSTNAGLLAVRMLAISIERLELLEALEDYALKAENDVIDKAMRLETVGCDKY
jgi:phosphoribosylaminoimidazole carboxylase